MRENCFAGSFLGAAIGDALGHPVEFIDSFAAIRTKYGPVGVKGFELFWDRDGKHFAPYTDDTQMAELVARALVDTDGSDLDRTMRAIADQFVLWQDKPQGGHRAAGKACLDGAAALKKGAKWFEAGEKSEGGCGSVVRAFPFGLAFSHDAHRAEEWAVAHSLLTHGDPIAKAACAAMAVGMASIVRQETLPEVFACMIGAASKYSPKTAAMMAIALDDALAGVEPEVTLDRLRGWAAHEAIAAAIYVTARHPDNAEKALLEAANTPGDSDSIATLVGAMVGGRVGVSALPQNWLRDVERGDDLLTLAISLANTKSKAAWL